MRINWKAWAEITKLSGQLVLMAPVMALGFAALAVLPALIGVCVLVGVYAFAGGAARLAEDGVNLVLWLFGQGPWGWAGGFTLLTLIGGGVLAAAHWWERDKSTPPLTSPLANPLSVPQPEAAPEPPPAHPDNTPSRPSARSVAASAAKGAVWSVVKAKLGRRPVSAAEVAGAAVRSATATARARPV